MMTTIGPRSHHHHHHHHNNNNNNHRQEQNVPLDTPILIETKELPPIPTWIFEVWNKSIPTILFKGINGLRVDLLNAIMMMMMMTRTTTKKNIMLMNIVTMRMAMTMAMTMTMRMTQLETFGPIHWVVMIPFNRPKRRPQQNPNDEFLVPMNQHQLEEDHDLLLRPILVQEGTVQLDNKKKVHSLLLVLHYLTDMIYYLICNTIFCVSCIHRKTTFRSGTPPPPPVIGDLYNQLFWYGFDPEDTTSPADKTMFGGTKGKFNGLAFLDDALVPKPKDPAPRRTSSRPSSRRRDNYYYEDDDDDIDDYKEERTFSDTLEQLSRQQSNLNPNVPTRARNDQDRDDNDDDVYKEEPPRKRFASRYNRIMNADVDDDFVFNEDLPTSNGNFYFVTPPNDHPQIYPVDNFTTQRSPIKNQPKRRRQRQSPWEEEEDDNQVNVDGRRKRRKINYSEDDNNWVSSKVANWFRDDVDGEDDEYAMESTTTRSHGRRGRKQQQFWAAPFDLLESFLVQENRDMSYEAEMYNRQMGLGSQRNDRETIGPSGKPRRQRRGSGYAYRYDVDTLEYDNVVDADIIADDETEKSEKSSQGSAQDMKTRSVQNESNASSDTTKTVNKADKTDEGSTSSPTNKKSWEERALAMEQIPPPGIPAWGPSGDLGMDARMKATIDALHDIQEAQNKLEQRKKREQEAMDDITILKVYVSLSVQCKSRGAFVD